MEEKVNDLSGLQFGYVPLAIDGRVMDNRLRPIYLTLPFDDNYSQWQYSSDPKNGWPVSSRIENLSDQSFWPWRCTARGFNGQSGNTRFFSQIRVRRISMDDVAGELRAKAHLRTFDQSLPRTTPYLRRLSLFACDLSGVDFTDCEMAGASFYHCNLDSAVFKNAWLTNAQFIHCYLKNVDFKGTEALGCNFMGSDLVGASFTNSNVGLANFWQAHNVNLEGALSTDLVAYVKTGEVIK